MSTCHSCGAAGAYNITQTSCVRCGAKYRPTPDAPCPNCQQHEPIVGDECSGCGFTGRCRTCNADTDFSPDPLYCDDICRKAGETERYAFDRS